MRLVLAIVLCVGIAVVPTFAHHSMGTYDQTTLVTIKGTVTKVEWRNPHTWITLSVSNADGTASIRRIEIAGPGALTRRGVPVNLLSLGDNVTLESWLPKNPGSAGGAPNGRVLILADGRRFDVGDNWP
jgi:Family of unknown function (DUF6152)